MIVKYDTALADLILDRMAEGEGMDSICADSQMPPRRIVRRWLVQHPEFLGKYNQARDLQAESVADEIIRLERALITGKMAVTQPDGTVEMCPIAAGAVNAAIQSMQWRMERLCPKRWGRKVEVAKPIGELRRMTDAELEAIIAGEEGSNSAAVGPPPRAGRLN